MIGEDTKPYQGPSWPPNTLKKKKKKANGGGPPQCIDFAAFDSIQCNQVDHYIKASTAYASIQCNQVVVGLQRPRQPKNIFIIKFSFFLIFFSVAQALVVPSIINSKASSIFQGNHSSYNLRQSMSYTLTAESSREYEEEFLRRRHRSHSHLNEAHNPLKGNLFKEPEEGSEGGRSRRYNLLHLGKLESLEEDNNNVRQPLRPDDAIGSPSDSSNLRRLWNATGKRDSEEKIEIDFRPLWNVGPYFVGKYSSRDNARGKIHSSRGFNHKKNLKLARSSSSSSSNSRKDQLYLHEYQFLPNKKGETKLLLDSDEFNEERLIAYREAEDIARSSSNDAAHLARSDHGVMQHQQQLISTVLDSYQIAPPRKSTEEAEEMEPEPTKSEVEARPVSSGRQRSSGRGSSPRLLQDRKFKVSLLLDDVGKSESLLPELSYQNDDESVIQDVPEEESLSIYSDDDDKEVLEDAWLKDQSGKKEEGKERDSRELWGAAAERYENFLREDLASEEEKGSEDKEEETEKQINNPQGINSEGPGQRVTAYKEESQTRTKNTLRRKVHFPSRRHKRKTGMVEVSVVEGGLAVLPCDLRVADENDSVQLILWIKEGLHTPLYSYDYREMSAGLPKETKPDANSTLARRTSFRMDSSPAALLVDRVEADDGGIYRCRVDFLLSPTINRRVNLTVIVPPSRARVSWSIDPAGGSATPLVGREAGPFLENSQPTLICTNDDGWPPASVLWYERDELLDDSYTVDHEREMVENELTLPPLTRADLGRRLTCLASNTNSTQPATATITITMILSIMGVKVMEVDALWAGDMSVVDCRIWGSRPPPSTVWWLGSLMLPPTENKVTEDDNVTISSLHFKPDPKDDGAMLICQATNEKLPDQAVQDSRLITVNYAPLVKVKLGRSLDPRRIKEGDDVYFECSVVSKPPVFKVIWRHNGKELVSGPGVFLPNMSLVLQGVTRSHGGNYTCHATNERDTSASPPLYLDVKYTPVCASEQRQQHSVGKLENAEISCKVHANPANVTFRWTFNNTAEAIDVPDGRFVVVGTESRVNYTPMNELDYGTLLCWANNTIGMQQQPCVFHIVAAGKPDPPHNCRVFDVTISSLQVTCLPGDDGGLSQSFLVQVYQIGSTSPVVEKTRHSPSFSVANLRPATAYKIVVAAINEKGASSVKELKAYTVRVPETQEETSAEPTRDRDRGSKVPLAVIIGTAVAAVPAIVVVAVLLWLKLCRSNRRGSGGGGDSGSGESSSGGIGEVTTHSANSKEAVSTELTSDNSPKDDRNPDIISHTPDPTGWSSQCGDIATISTSSYLLPNGGSTYPSSTIAPAAATTVGGMEYSQLVCPETGYTHIHAPAHPVPHSQLPSTAAAAAVTQVPYYIETAQQQQLVEVDLPPPPPPSYNQGYPTIEHQHQQHPSMLGSGVAAAVQSYSTLERKRRRHGCHLPPEQSDEGATAAAAAAAAASAAPASFDVSQQGIFPHLYQTPSGNLSKTPQSSSQYSLAKVQGSVCSVQPTTATTASGGEPLVQPGLSQGTLRRVSSKKSVGSDRSGVVQTSPSVDRIHHHLCELSQSQTLYQGDSTGGSAGGTLKRLRRTDKRTPPSDGQESEGDHSCSSSSGTLRKSKRESAV